MSNVAVQAPAAVQAQYRTCSKLAAELAKSIAELASYGQGTASEAMVQMSLYEAHRRLEDCMHRSSDMVIAIAHATPEGIDAVVNDALAKGQVQGAPPELKIVEAEPGQETR